MVNAEDLDGRRRLDSFCGLVDIGATDRDGHRRLDLFTGFVDIGAYEYLPKGTVVSIR